MKSELQSKFLSPLREMLVIARAHAKQELELKTQEEKKRRGREHGTSEEEEEEGERGPELSVEVMGETLPKPSHQDEIKVRRKWNVLKSFVPRLCYTK